MSTDDSQKPVKTWHDHANIVLMSILAVGSVTSAGLSCRSSQIAADSLAETQRNNQEQQVESRRANKEQQDKTNEQLKSLQVSMRQQTAATVYTMGLEVSKLLIQHPFLRDYFENVPNYFKSKPVARRSRAKLTAQEIAQERAKQREAIIPKLEKESAERQAQIWAYAEYLADFMEFAYVHKELQDPKDWEGWWNYICDQYDTSPVFREYCNLRGGIEGEEWYRFVNDVKKPHDEREKVGVFGSK